MRDRGDEYMDLVKKPERKIPLGEPRHRWEDNIKIDLQEADGALTGLIWVRTGTYDGLL
jgi:hypothetical protein